MMGNEPHLCFFAANDLLPGEEITYSYGCNDYYWRKNDNEKGMLGTKTQSYGEPSPPGQNRWAGFGANIRGLKGKSNFEGSGKNVQREACTSGESITAAEKGESSYGGNIRKRKGESTHRSRKVQQVLFYS